ncbi:hypothetical protein [Treponema bryantii]|uniref:hypothetical protein n=1 Tax=Treponema bryantii TaxID=163 RepID=UPI002B2BE454|nr:hypothetical protein TRBR_25340 [Treponema bryantii]
MNGKISIIQKDEAYSYDELSFIEENICPLITDKNQQTAVNEILKNLKAAIENKKTSAAIFFMPQTTFNIFSLLQGDNSICKIQKEDIEALNNTFESIDNCNQPIFKHFKKKLKILNEYLQEGNSVSPTVIAADNFSDIKIK